MKPGFFAALFFVSGFCSLVYEVVWLRLAMAQFGVTTPLVSIVLSVFMAGLAVGSSGGGRLAAGFRVPPARLVQIYAVIELAIASSADIVPAVLAHGGRTLASADTASWDSLRYHLVSGLWVTLALLPFCVCMGATFPVAMAAIRRLAPQEDARSFSRLYAANVAGACVGTLACGFVLVELLGFRGTLSVAKGLNALLAAGALALSLRVTAAAGRPEPLVEAAPAPGGDGVSRWWILWALFATGTISMAMEVVWVRLLTPYLGNVVYTFASILAIYLLSTYAGSQAYRARAGRASALAFGAAPWAVIAVASQLPVVAADPRYSLGHWPVDGLLRAALGIIPVCAALGFVTPLLVDHWSAGEPRRAGLAYAVNVVGGILGPLLAGFWLLPVMGERWTLVALGLPLLALGAVAGATPAVAAGARRPAVALGAAVLSVAALLALTRSYESQFPDAVTRRDSTATVTAWGGGMRKLLMVNGVSMTYLTPVTKMMVHLPLVLEPDPPRNALIICFGMGTSFRSALAWDIDATVVELVPSVPGLFGYFHDDGPALLRSPKAHVVIDDGRRFLERSRESYDVVVIDPPPPVQAAGSSLLYSREFYASLERRLAPRGIVQQWIPGAPHPVTDPVTVTAFVRAFRDSFPYARAFVSYEGAGLHLLGSRVPIVLAPLGVLAARLPAGAVRDMEEWSSGVGAAEQLDVVLHREVPMGWLVDRVPGVGPLRDDRPVNEYYLLRASFGPRPAPVVTSR
jgi:spermidine synthase